MRPGEISTQRYTATEVKRLSILLLHSSADYLCTGNSSESYCGKFIVWVAKTLHPQGKYIRTRARNLLNEIHNIIVVRGD